MNKTSLKFEVLSYLNSDKIPDDIGVVNLVTDRVIYKLIINDLRLR